MLFSKLKNVKLGEVNWTALVLEMVVVFLGVTAGFLLNNWQSERADRELEQKYIADFLADVEENITNLEENLESDSLWIERARPVIDQIGKGELHPDSAVTAIQLIAQLNNSTFQKSTYENITNSGNLNLITDYAARKQIVDYHLQLEGMVFIDEYFENFFTSFVMPFIFENYNVYGGQIRDRNIVRTLQFKNVHIGYFSMMQQAMAQRKSILEASYELQGALKMELE